MVRKPIRQMSKAKRNQDIMLDHEKIMWTTKMKAKRRLDCQA